MPRFSAPVRGALAGAVVGIVLTMLLVVTDHDPATPRSGPVVAAAFIADWRHQLEGTYVEVMRFERRTAAGGHLVSEQIVAQRPPDTFSSGFGTIEARRGDRLLACGQGASGQLDCRDAGPAPPYRMVVDQRVANVASYLQGETRIYDVRRQSRHCYQLKQVVPVRTALSLPFGTEATFCFDPVSGALRSRRTVRPSAVETLVATSIRTFVTDADLAPKPGTPGRETFVAPHR
jgi:hypothetical protein